METLALKDLLEESAKEAHKVLLDHQGLLENPLREENKEPQDRKAKLAHLEQLVRGVRKEHKVCRASPAVQELSEFLELKENED